jgi:N-acetylneuraminate synthase
MCKAETVVRIGNRVVGDGEPTFTIAEIGINHNGSRDIALQLIEGAHRAGCDAVKLQKRTPELCTPRDQWHVQRETPWGRLSYLDYRRKIELLHDDYAAIDRRCKELGMAWFASCWDEESVDFIEAFDPPCYKAASASLTDHALLRKMRATGRPLVVSTGMSTMDEILAAVEAVGTRDLLLAHSTSTYPCPPSELNLKMILTLKAMYPSVPIGYSGHETGLVPTFSAVSLGATFVERHVTLDRAMWGSDQAASVELAGLARLVAGIRDIEEALGDGIKRFYESERGAWAKLRRVRSAPNGNSKPRRGLEPKRTEREKHA